MARYPLPFQIGDGVKEVGSDKPLGFVVSIDGERLEIDPRGGAKSISRKKNQCYIFYRQEKKAFPAATRYAT